MKKTKTFTTTLLLLFTLTVTSQTIYKSSIDSGGSNVAVGDIQVLYTLGETNIQELSVGNIQVSEGFISPEVQIAIKINPAVFLQGAILNPAIAGLMNDDLRVASLIPTTSPYVDVLTCEPSVLAVTGTDAIVDWVWIELRDAGDNTVVLASQSALVQRDGDVVAIDGILPLSFDIANGNYYVSVAHRNHLGIITANTVSLSSTVTILTLTSNSTLINGGINAVVDLGNGSFALYAGDYDGNGQIQNSDLSQVTNLIGNSGYSDADADMNSQVQNADVSNVVSPNIGNGEQNKKTTTKQPTITAPLSALHKSKKQ